MKKAVLLLSSGLDSAANLALARSGAGPASFDIKLALTIDYGQKGARRELEQAARLATHFGVEHVRLEFRDFSRLIGAQGALLGEDEVPEPRSLDDVLVTTQTAKAVWVPNRNGVMLSLAAALAESRGLDAVAVGFNAEEAVTFPDNTPDYMEAVTRSLAFSTANKVEVVSATARMTKSEIVRALANQDFPFSLLWSCYKAGSHHCGMCESCQRLKRAVASSLDESRAREVLGSLFG